MQTAFCISVAFKKENNFFKGLIMNDEILTAEQVGECLNLSPHTIKKWAARGKIPSIRISPKVLRFEWAEVKKAIQGKDNE